MTTIIDLAKEAGVSKTTISRYLNGEAKGHISPQTQVRIKKAIQDLNYRPNEIARELKGTKTKVVGIVVNDLSNPFFLSMLQEIDLKLRDSGYNMMVCNSEMDVTRETELLKMLDQKRMDGIIVIGLNMSAAHVTRLGLSAPIVFFERDEEECKYDSLKIDNKKGTELATEYLIHKGYRRIAHITGSGNSVSQERTMVFLHCMKEEGITVPQDYIECGNYKMDEAYLATERLFQLKEKPDAIFCSNDSMAFGAMRYLLEHSYRIPYDVGIVGYDDTEMAQVVTPALTTIRQPVRRLAQMGTEILLQRMGRNKEFPRQDIVLEPELVVRRSS